MLRPPSFALVAACLALELGSPLPAAPQEPAEEAAAPSAEEAEAAALAAEEAAVRDELFGEGRALELTIDAALAIAETNNLGLAIEDVNTEVARYDAFGSWGTYDWVLAANGSFADGQQQGSSQLSGASVLEFEQQSYDLSLSRPLEFGGSFAVKYDTARTRTNNSFSLDNPSSTDHFALTYNQPLLRGFGTGYGTSLQRESEVNYRAQTERRREVLQALLRDVYNAYWDLVQRRQELEVAGSSLDLGLEQLDRNRRMLDAGVGTEVEVIQAEAEVAKRIETLLAAEVAVRAAGDALKSLTFPGKDPASWDTELVPITPLPEPGAVSGEVAPWEELLNVALENRPELLKQRQAIEAAKLRHERSLSERRAGLDLELGVSGQGYAADWQDSASEAFQFEYPTYTAGLHFDMPLQNRSARYAEKSARAQLRAAHLAYEELETRVVGEVRDAVRQVRYQAEAVSAAQKSLEAAQRQLDAEEARYRNDLSTNFQLLEFQLRLVEAMKSEQQARVNYVKALYQLQVAQGVLGEAR